MIHSGSLRVPLEFLLGVLGCLSGSLGVFPEAVAGPFKIPTGSRKILRDPEGVPKGPQEVHWGFKGFPKGCQKTSGVPREALGFP